MKQSLEFSVLDVLYSASGEAKLRQIYERLAETSRESLPGQIRRSVSDLCQSGSVEKTPLHSYLITPKGRERFLSQLAQHDPESPLLRRKKLIVQAKVEALEEGGYLAFSDEIQGCHAEGETVAEALANLEDVARILLELRREDGRPLPEELEEFRPDRTLKAQVVVALPE